MTTTQQRAWKLMDALDTEDDDRRRCDFICELQDIADADPNLRGEIKAYGIPVS